MPESFEIFFSVTLPVSIKAVFDPLNSFLWGPIMLIMLLGVGLYLMVRHRFLPLRKLPMGFALMWHGRKPQSQHGSDDGELSPFNALMTALAATVGTGNIVGVATAIYMGGPGAVFWMWCTALVGMATKFTEVILAVRYREVTPDGSYVGGPMYYIKNGLGSKWKPLAFAFAVFGAVAGFGIGNMTQVNAIADTLHTTFGADTTVVGLVIFVLIGLIILGGLKRIGAVAGKLVPFMAIFYILASLFCLVLHLDKVPGAFALIFTEAFNPTALGGGITGGLLAMTIRYGMARGVFSNEAGMGSSPIAHATARTNNPVRQGLVGMLGTFLDTIIICSMTALVILVSGAWDAVAANFNGGGHLIDILKNTLPTEQAQSLIEPFKAAWAEVGPKGSFLSAKAFSDGLPGTFGKYVVSCGLTLFAFTTILGWCVYSERCAVYLFGHKALKPFRFLFILVVPVGAMTTLDTVWMMADTFNAMMIIPNLIALIFLAPVATRLSHKYFTEGEESTTFEALKLKEPVNKDD